MTTISKKQIQGLAVLMTVMAMTAFTRTHAATLDITVASGNIAPIEEIVLDDNGSTVTQTVSQSGVIANRATALNIVTIELVNGTILNEFNNTGVDVVLQGFATWQPTSGIGVLESNGSQVNLVAGAANIEAFRVAAADAVTNSNLNNYIFYDNISPSAPPSGVPDFDVVFDVPFQPGDYLLVQERNGNTFFEVTALDVNGDPISGANVLRFDSEYDWNTGYANSSYQTSQPYELSVTLASNFFVNTAVTPQPVYGLRIDNDGQADIKFFVLSDDPFFNLIDGTVYVDQDENGSFGGIDIAAPDVTVKLYIDENNDGMVDGGDTLIQTTVTDADGNYDFAVGEAGNFVIEVDETTLPPGTALLSDNVEEADFVDLGNTDSGNDFRLSVSSDAGVCYAVADGSNPDLLVTIPRAGGSGATSIGNTATTTTLEAMTLSLDGSIIYAAHVTGGVGVFGTLNNFNGDFTAISPAGGIGSGDGDQGNIVFQDVDGITIDPRTGRFYGSVRLGTNDILFEIDPATGEYVPDVFTGGADYVTVNASGLPGSPSDVDDISINPVDGLMYAIVNPSDRLVTIDMFTGAVTDVGRLNDGTSNVNDMEGLSFFNDGSLYGATGTTGTPANTFWSINPANAMVTQIAAFGTSSDYESIACLTGGSNFIEGTVFEDDNVNGVLDGSDTGTQTVTVNLYIDENNDGVVDVNDTLIQTATTDANGEYIFEVALTGNFVIEIDETTLPPGASLTTDNAEQADFTDFGNTDSNNDFGWASSGTVGNYVWLDENGDGVQDAGEDGIANVLVTLSGTDSFGNAVNLTTYTDANGGYLFNNVPDGNYSVTITAPGGMDITFDEDQGSAAGGGTPDNATTLSITNGEEHLTADFGLNWVPYTSTDSPSSGATGAIGDRIWNDANGDGSQDPGESGISGVTVRLLTDDNGDGVYGGTGDNTALTTVTNDNGNYVFDGLDAGAYVIEVDNSTLPSGFETSPTGDPDGDGDNISEPIVLAPGDVFVNADFGYQPNSGLGNSIGDRVWLDADRDGAQDPGEAGIPGVVVELTWFGPDNTPGGGDDVLYVTTTDENGEYLFDNLPDGDFGVTTALAENTGSGGPLDDLTVSYDKDGGTSTPDGLTEVNLSGGNQAVDDIDFGYSPSDGTGPEGIIGDTIFIDANGNGQVDPGEGVPGIDVTLDPPAGVDLGAGDGNPVTTTTDANGNYYFGDLPAGDYTVMVDTTTTLSGLTNAIDPDGGTASESQVSLATDNSIDLGQDFGYSGTNPLTSSIGDTIWLDADGNGMIGPGENGIPGVLVELTYFGPDGVAGGGDDATYLTITDENGQYLFDDLPNGEYSVTTDLPENNNAGGPLNGLFDSYDKDGGTSTPNGTTPVTLSGNVTDVDFGFSPSDGAGSEGVIGDTIFNDLNGNGLPDPGEGIPGVEVELSLNSGGGSTFITYTDANGNYYFGDLPTEAGGSPIDWLVQVNTATLPGGSGAFTNTVDPDGGTLDQSVVTLSNADPVNLDQDFGYQTTASGSIGDTVYLDADGDGTLDSGEPGIEGVSVALIYDADGSGTFNSGDSIIGTQLTDENGKYNFTGLSLDDGGGDAQYLVWVNDTDHVLGDLLATGDDDGSSPASGDVTGLGISAVTLSSGAPIDLDQDFGFAPPGHDSGDGLIGDRIFLDADGSDSFTAGDTGLEGVVVELYDAAGTTLLDSTETDENGNYYFGNLGATTEYTVKVDVSSLPGGVSNSFDPDGTPDNSAVIDLGAAGSDGVNDPDGTDNGINLGADFGYKVTSPNTINGTIWGDTDANGTLDEAGTGLEGITVALIDSNGNIVATTTTDSDGNYSFGGLPDGTYTLDVTDKDNLLAGYWHSDGPNDGSDNNSQVDPYSVTVNSGNPTDNSADFGYYKAAASVGNVVFDDLDGDGVRDTGEPGIGGVEVTLTITYPTSGADTVVTVTTVTDAEGQYSFDNLLLDEDYNSTGTGKPSFSLVVDSNQAELAGAASAENGLDATDETTEDAGPGVDNDADAIAGSNAFPVQGATDATNDFGFFETATLGDRIWLDEDGDGIQDASEEGVPNVTVTLTPPAGVDIGNGPGGDITTTTDAQGNYLFTGLPPGDFTVSYAQPSGTTPIYDPDGGTTSPSNSAPVTLVSGQNKTDADFGLNYGGGAIGDLVWSDSDGDGAKDDNELGIPGVYVVLMEDTNNDGLIGGSDRVAGVATTDANGNYVFTGLATDPDSETGDILGVYSVYVVGLTDPGLTVGSSTIASFTPAAPSSHPTQTYDLDGSLDNATTDPVQLTSGFPQMLDADFGYQNSSLADVSGTVFEDVVTDGIKNLGTDDSPLEGVSVNLVNSNGDIVATSTTDANGDYFFSDVPAGDYSIEVGDTGNILAGMYQTADPDESNVCTTCDGKTTTAITVPASGNVAGGDFGYVRTGLRTGSIGNTIFYDLDGDRAKGSGEAGIPGVTVEIRNSSGILVGTAVTDENGVYLFDGLDPAQAYDVSIVTSSLPNGGSGLANTADPDNPGMNGDSTANIDLGASGSDGVNDPDGTDNGINLGADFGYRGANTVGGTVWNESEPDGELTNGAGGTVDESSSGVGGVTVALYDSNGNLVGTTVTAADGNYSFPGLPDGTYFVIVTDQSGVLQDSVHVEAPVAMQGMDNFSQLNGYAVTVNPGNPSDSSADFGFFEQFVFTATPAVVTAMRSTVSADGSVAVSWLNASETGAAAFRLERWIELKNGHGHWKRVHKAAWIPSLGLSQGGYYSARVEGVAEGETHRYRVVELTEHGKHIIYDVAQLTAELNDDAAPVTSDTSAAGRFEFDKIAKLANARASKAKMTKGTGNGGNDGGNADALRLMVSEPGLYLVSYTDLSAAFGMSARKLATAIVDGDFALSTEGRDVSWFAHEDGLVFYGQGIDTSYTRDRVYWLRRNQGVVMSEFEVGAASGAEAASYLRHTDAEIDSEFRPFLSEDAYSDMWYWDFLFPLAAFQTRSFDIPVPAVQAADGSLIVRLGSGLTGDYSVTVSANGQLLGTIFPQNYMIQDIELHVPAAAFNSEVLSVEMTLTQLSGTPGMILIDGFSLDYLSAYQAQSGELSFGAAGSTRVSGLDSDQLYVLDISDARNPQWVHGGEIIATGTGFDWSAELPAGEYFSAASFRTPVIVEDMSSDLSNHKNQADYLVITTADFMPAAEALADYRASQGLKSYAIDIQDVYDEYGYGMPDPFAIQKLVIDSRNWKRSPDFVAILGDGSSDYLDIWGTGYNLITPLVSFQDSDFGRLGIWNDLLSGDLDGDRVPEVAVGRIPVKTLEEATAFVNKLQAYEVGIAEYPVMLLADNADEGGDFAASSDAIGEFSTAPVAEVYFDGSNLAETRNEFFDLMDMGVSLVNFAGHGGTDRLANEGIVVNADAETMDNSYTPALIGLTCNINAFSIPGWDSLGERLVINPDGGMIASFSAAGLSENIRAERLGKQFQIQLNSSDRLGDAVIKSLIGEGPWTEIYSIIGDPATKLH
ncbi:MAG: hypothetical protein HKO64_04530 [Xanthomonadales bacterium]|nr:hypothetical protein [Xanthomonadales bacterium]